MLKNAMNHFLGHRRSREPADSPGRVQLPLPTTLSASLGYDAVGVPARHGFRLMSHLPRTGCVFADGERWWWIVPAGSDLDLDWPEQVAYARGRACPRYAPGSSTNPTAARPTPRPSRCS